MAELFEDAIIAPTNVCMVRDQRHMGPRGVAAQSIVSSSSFLTSHGRPEALTPRFGFDGGGIRILPSAPIRTVSPGFNPGGKSGSTTGVPGSSPGGRTGGSNGCHCAAFFSSASRLFSVDIRRFISSGGPLVTCSAALGSEGMLVTTIHLLESALGIRVCAR